MQDQVTQISNHLEQLETGIHIGHFGGYQLTSHFQPIANLRGGQIRVEGFEALVRPMKNGEPVSPYHFFQSVQASEQFHVDWLCRALHLRNFAHLNRPGKKLYLNLNPATYTDTVSSEQLIEVMATKIVDFGLNPSDIVCEIVETSARHHDTVDRVIERFRAVGTQIAIDDFGAQCSNFDRLLHMRPDIVKIDMSLLARCAGNHRMQTLYANITHLLHDLGIRFACEGIETADDLSFVQGLNASFAQGFYLARPCPTPESDLVYERQWQGHQPCRKTSQHAPVMRNTLGAGALATALPG